jgi:hypothetical protein
MPIVHLPTKSLPSSSSELNDQCLLNNSGKSLPLTMISTLSTDWKHTFEENPREYLSNPDASDCVRIKMIEQAVTNRDRDWLEDPESLMIEWEDLTGEEFPEQFLEEFPQEIAGFVVGPQGSRGYRGLAFGILPILDRKGNKIQYPEDRLVASYYQRGQRVYILNDGVYAKLAK